MATTKKPTPATAAPAKGTAVIDWKEEMERKAKAAAKMEESVSTGATWSLKSGVLSINDTPMPGNTMAVVIVDHILENVLYEGEYDAANLESPACFAFGRDESIAPHEKAVAAGNSPVGASGRCAECPANAWGSADKGKGKACANKRRLAMIPAGTLDKNGNFKAFTKEEEFDAGITFMKLPTMSVKGYAAYVKQLAAVTGRPPFGVFTKVTVVPDTVSQFRVVFECLGEVPDKLMPKMITRNTEAEGAIEQPYDMEPKAETPKGKKAAAPAKKAAAKVKKY